MSSKALDFLKAENVDIYGLLGIPPDASDSVIRRAYRKQALIYHPDKNPDPAAATTFHQLTLALSVLTDLTQKKQYDGWMQAVKAQEIRDEQMGQERKRMKDELEKAERRGKSSSSWSIRDPSKSRNAFAIEVERLREEGTNKRRKLEQEQQTMADFSSSNTNSEPSVTTFPSERTVRVKWKSKQAIVDLFTVDVIEGILSIFGEIEKVQKLGKDPNAKRIELGIVIFKSRKSAQRAIKHDFREKSDMWENTSYKKLSSLIKSVEWYDINETGLSMEEYKDQTVERLRRYANEKQHI